MEPLEVVMPDHWFSLLSLFPGDEGIIARATISMQIVNIKNYPEYPMKAYSPGGDTKEGIVFIWKPTDKLTEISVFCSKQDKSTLKQSLANTQIINKKAIIIYCNLQTELHSHIAEVINRSDKITDDTIVAHLPCDKAKSYTIENHLGARLETIGPEYAEEIDLTWPHKYPGSVDYFKTMLSFGSAIGIISEDNNELMGWIFTTIRGDLHALHIKDSCRRKGYAQLLVKVMSKRLADQGIDDILAYIITDNTASMDLFEKCGFQFLNTVRWFVFGDMLDETL